MIWTTLQQRLAGSGVGRWFNGRESNEQRIIAVLAVVVVITLLWLMVWQPISDWRATAHNRYQNAQAQLDWMRANEDRARAVARSGNGPAGAGRSLQVITRSAQAQGLQVNRLQPEANGVVSVSIQGQPFNDILQWLNQLQENNGVSVLRLAVDADDRPGVVNAQIRLQ